MCGVPILPLSDLDKFCAEHHPEVAVLCVPRQSAMDLAGELVNQGIKGFWNFSHYDLSVEYPDVTVENVHLGDSLMSLDTGCGIRRSNSCLPRRDRLPDTGGGGAPAPEGERCPEGAEGASFAAILTIPGHGKALSPPPTGGAPSEGAKKAR